MDRRVAVLSSPSDERSWKSALNRRQRERRRRRWLYPLIKTPVVAVELFEMRSVPTLHWVVDHKDQPGPLPPAAADASGHLDVLRRRLRLPDDAHQGESIYIDTDFNYTGSQTYIERLVVSFGIDG